MFPLNVSSEACRQTKIEKSIIKIIFVVQNTRWMVTHIGILEMVSCNRDPKIPTEHIGSSQNRLNFVCSTYTYVGVKMDVFISWCRIVHQDSNFRNIIVECHHKLPCILWTRTKRCSILHDKPPNNISNEFTNLCSIWLSCRMMREQHDWRKKCH